MITFVLGIGGFLGLCRVGLWLDWRWHRANQIKHIHRMAIHALLSNGPMDIEVWLGVMLDHAHFGLANHRSSDVHWVWRWTVEHHQVRPSLDGQTVALVLDDQTQDLIESPPVPSYLEDQ